MILGVCLVLIAVGVIGYGIHWVSKDDEKKRISYEQAAIPVGLDKIREECNKEGFDGSVCSGLTAIATTTECEGRNCWIVHATSSDGQTYRADTFVKREGSDNHLVATDYMRNNPR